MEYLSIITDVYYKDWTDALRKEITIIIILIEYTEGGWDSQEYK
jgi:hypothetical protein